LHLNLKGVSPKRKGGGVEGPVQQNQSTKKNPRILDCRTAISYDALGFKIVFVAEASDVLPVAATTAPLMQYVRASLMDSRVNDSHLYWPACVQDDA